MLESFVRENIVYPQEAIDNEITGKVNVQFVVEKDGAVSNVMVHKGVHKLLDEEAVRIVKLTTWTPGTCNGKPIRTRLILPISFKLQ